MAVPANHHNTQPGRLGSVTLPLRRYSKGWCLRNHITGLTATPEYIPTGTGGTRRCSTAAPLRARRQHRQPHLRVPRSFTGLHARWYSRYTQQLSITISPGASSGMAGAPLGRQSRGPGCCLMWSTASCGWPGGATTGGGMTMTVA